MPQKKTKERPPAIAVFITPHGFGHAARATAVMIELHKLIPDITFHIYTKIPQWFFHVSYLNRFVYHEIVTDVGLIQRNAMDEDLPATIQRLRSFLPFPPELIRSLSSDVKSHGCRFVLCDIAPLGIAVAQQAGIPCLLQENFTWDWIYAGYPEIRGELAPQIQLLHSWFSRATFHFQTTPACLVDERFRMVNPVSRPLRDSRDAIRQSLDIHLQTPVVLITMGGIEEKTHKLAAMKSVPKALFIIIGASSAPAWEHNLLLLPHNHGIYHPDLVNACDAVVGKLGYSTLAECFAAGVSYGFIPRKRFPESAALADFALSSLNGLAIDEDEYASGDWVKKVPALLAQPRYRSQRANGAREIAGFIREQLAAGGSILDHTQRD